MVIRDLGTERMNFSCIGSCLSVCVYRLLFKVCFYLLQSSVFRVPLPWYEFMASFFNQDVVLIKFLPSSPLYYFQIFFFFFSYTEEALQNLNIHFQIASFVFEDESKHYLVCT